jgi:hypothetical protein
VEVDVDSIQAPSEATVRIGLECLEQLGSEGLVDGYSFVVSTGKTLGFEIIRIGLDGPSMVASATSTDVPFPNDRTSRLRGVCARTESRMALSLFVNGKKVISAEDPGPSHSFSALALSVSSDVAGIDVVFDNARMKGYGPLR